MTTAPGQGPRIRRSSAWILWIVLAASWLATLGARPLLDPDEGRYAEIPREMAASGDWVTPRLDGLKYFEKPPLQYWATAAAYSAFGVSEGPARLWTVGLAFLCLPLVFGWTSRLYGRAAGLAASMVLVVSPYFELIGHLNLLDAGFTFWLAGAVFAFTLALSARDGSGSERSWMLTAWVAAAIAVLSKGIVVGVLAGSTLVVYTLVERDRRPWRRLHVRLGLPLFLLVAAPWFLLVSYRNPGFAQFFFVHEHFARFLTTVHQRVEPWWYFGAIFIIGALPWLIRVPAAMRTAWVDPGLASGFKPLKFLAIFSTITVLFFSASGSKLAPYILPMMPTLAAIIGASVAGRPRFVQRVIGTSGFLLLVLVPGFVYYALRRYEYLPPACIPWLESMAAVTVFGLLAMWKWPSARKGRDLWLAPPDSRGGWVAAGDRGAWVAAASAVLAWQFLLCAYTQLPDRSAYKMLLTVKPSIRPETELFSVGQYRETISPYLQRTMTLVDFEGELAFGLADAGALPDAAFLSRWDAAADAVLFVNPAMLDAWQRRGLQGKVIGGDGQTLAVSRR